MKFYTKPEIEISVFSTESIMADSSVTGGTGDSTTPTGLTVGGALSETAADASYKDLF